MLFIVKARLMRAFYFVRAHPRRVAFCFDVFISRAANDARLTIFIQLMFYFVKGNTPLRTNLEEL